MSGPSEESTSSEADIKRLLSGMKALQTDVAGIKSEVSALFASAALSVDVSTLRTDLMARIDRLQDALTQQRVSDVVTYAAAERAETIAKATRSEADSLGDQMAALTRMVRRLETRMDQLEGDKGEGSAQ
jgi:chromosome segregation ATPase